MVVTKKVDTTAPDSRTEPKKASRDRVRKAKKNLKTEENQDESSNIVPEDEVGDPEPFSAELEVNSESQSNNEEELKPKNKKIVFEDIEMDDEIPSHIEDVVEDRKVPVEQPSPALEEEKEDSDDAPEEVQLSVTKEEGQKRRELERQLKQGYMSALDGLDWYRRKKKRRAHDSSSKKESQLLSEEVLNILNDNEYVCKAGSEYAIDIYWEERKRTKRRSQLASLLFNESSWTKDRMSKRTSI